MSVNEEFLREILRSCVVNRGSIGETFDQNKAVKAILQHFQQEQESTLKQGFYAGQANAGVKLEQAHKNWDKWNFGKGGKV